MTLSDPIIHVIDDDESLRRAVVRLLRAAGYQVLDYPSAAEFLLAQPANGPGCLVLDVRMPGASGLDLQQALNGREQALPIIFLTGHGDIPMSVQAIKAGAVDFLTKPVQREALLAAVKNALTRDADNRAAFEKHVSLRSNYDALTERERAVFALVVAGKLNKQIAGELGIAERTVKAHRAQVMQKMHVDSLAELVHVAEQLQLGCLPGERASAAAH